MARHRPIRDLIEPLTNTPERRARINEYERGIADTLKLGKLREARGVTQQVMANRLQVSQPNVSRIEHEDDVYVSTLRGYVEALGGRLEIRAVFPDGDVVVFVGAPEHEDREQVHKRRGA